MSYPTGLGIVRSETSDDGIVAIEPENDPDNVEYVHVDLLTYIADSVD